MQPATREYLDFLRQSPYRPAEWMHDYQSGLIERLLRHAREQVPFYRDRLRAVFSASGRFNRGLWQEIPILTRRAAMEAGPDLFARELPQDTGGWTEKQTSGSTGIPFRHRRSDLARFVNVCVRHRDYERYDLNFDAALAIIGSSAESRSDDRRPWNFLGSGPMLRFSVRSSVQQQFEWLQRVRAPYLAVYPSLLRALAEFASRLQSCDLTFEAMLTFGENLTLESRQFVQETFGGRVIDSYGATETGRVASECRTCGRFHIASEAVLLEVLRDDGIPAGPGEVGRVVVTPFYNFAMPLIRYEIGDIAEIGSNGVCDLLLPTLDRVLGRTRNLFKLPDGSRVWPDTRARDMLRYIGFVQLQVVQTAVEEIEVRYVADGSNRTPDDVGLQEYFRSVLHPSLNVRAVAVNQIARSPSGKFDDYVSLVG